MQLSFINFSLQLHSINVDSKGLHSEMIHLREKLRWGWDVSAFETEKDGMDEEMRVFNDSEFQTSGIEGIVREAGLQW